ncbi:MAG: ATP-dependent sacrificial sulfur transferase LarE [Deltaproteobacteria bacterium]|nr:ATP-dependent sacrificial sulfur transferase LarE [Deltaproteobacteria bacterium]
MDKFLATQKKEELVRKLKNMPSLLVAFSGGVDSTFLLAVAADTLGDRVIAVTANSFIHPFSDRQMAAEFVTGRGIKHIVFDSAEIKIPGFTANSPDRCYHCKKALCNKLRQIAEEKGISHIAHAINTDDLGDYRPGIKAAEETGLIAPLVDAGLSKQEIRYLSKEMGLATWDKPSMACLASRIPYGTAITEEKISMIEKAEKIIAHEGFRQYRVRHHGTVARIEVSENEISRLMDTGLREKIISGLKKLGFKHIALDLEGYTSGSMNRDIELFAEKIDEP